MKITKNRGKVRGSLATLRDCFWHKEEPWGVVQLPSGTKVAIPLSSTDIPREALPISVRTPQIDAMRLLEMARFCQQLPRPKDRKRRRRSSKKK